MNTAVSPTASQRTSYTEQGNSSKLVMPVPEYVRDKLAGLSFQFFKQKEVPDQVGEDINKTILLYLKHG